MRGHNKTLAGLLGLIAASLATEVGCQSPARRSIVGSSVTNSSEPGLSAEIEPGVAVYDSPTTTASASPARTVSVVDRHPLLRKPKQYYDNTNSNKAVKTAAAAVVGVPAGIVGEIKQIVVGTPSGSTTTTSTTLPAY